MCVFWAWVQQYVVWNGNERAHDLIIADKNIEYLFNVNPIVIYFMHFDGQTRIVDRTFVQSKYLHSLQLNWQMDAISKLIKPWMLFICTSKFNSIILFVIWICTYFSAVLAWIFYQKFQCDSWTMYFLFFSFVTF